MSAAERRVNLGCGDDVRDGWVNVDYRPGETGVGGDDVEPDVNQDLTETPWPFEDDAFDHALMDNVLEHLPNATDAVREVARIVEPGGTVEIRCPYPNNPSAHRTDHVRHIHPVEFLEGNYLYDGLFEVADWELSRVRLGRVFPSDESALWVCDTFGLFGIDEWSVTLRILDADD
ncbi:class I SAM-dependent methyltransferase [Halogeometricum limi]|uniref:Methyltransferase domain-containing protein n=1 Tax=Halogeometricum limi TaxID=555875 RepID=A0A1I6GUZ0_9EURY|nr:methyltransferase domain-containing protein [Halogeometricum limi]SFR45877.1 Methyltransferase domain-containing protein [Halogeometricum limi]